MHRECCQGHILQLKGDDFQKTRAKLQRVLDGLTVPCWVEKFQGEDLCLIAPMPSGLSVGDRVLVTMDGENSMAMTMAEVQKLVPCGTSERVETRLKMEPVKSSKKASRRVQVTNMKAKLSCLDQVVEVTIVDLSTSGIAVISPKRFNENALVDILIKHQGQPVEMRGRIKYSLPKDGEFRCGIQLLQASQLTKTRLDWLAAA